MKTRKDSFLGMHFDFHASPDQTGIGSFLDHETIGRLLDEVKPDYIQCDTKGHAGATSYPTKVGNPAPDMKGDILALWRKETAKRDIALYAHHSGVWDNTAMRLHPDWAVAYEDGKCSAQKASVFGPYADELLIPQLCEMALDYKLDGAWVDGECWATEIDRSDWAKDAYRKQFGKEPPAADSREWLDFCRQGFRDYLTKYINAVHEAAPSFQITSNWMYTSFVPEKPEVPVDFISGDYSPSDSLNTARFEGRVMQNQGKGWDLMAWGFSNDGARCVKENAQMEQEAAAVILLGGGFQFYNHQLVGSVQGWAIPRWKELADFCRARQELCWKANPIPQAAIVLSTKAFYENKKSLFTPYDSAYISDMHGLLYACLDAQISTEILLTHRILELTDAELDRYGVLIVSDLTTIEAELRDRLLGYAKRGGSLLIVGAHSAAAAAAKAGCAVTEPAGSGLYLCEEGGIAPVVTEWTRFTSLADGWKVIGSAVTNDDSDDGAFPIAAERNFGSGKLALISFSAGGYQSFKTAVVRDFFGRILNRLFTPAVRVSGSKLVEVMLTEKNGAAVVNLMNTAGAHSDGHYHSVDEIPPLTDLTVEIDCPKPTAVTWEPDGIVPEHFWENGVLTVKLPRLAIHGAIRIVK